MISPILITGMGRAGTTLLTYLCKNLSGCFVLEQEAHPKLYPAILSRYNVKKSKYFIFKQPFTKIFSPSYRKLNERGIRVLSLTRDPRDVLTSRHRENMDIYWAEIEPTKAAGREHLRNVDNGDVLLLRYEDLVTKPDDTMNLISQFLNVEYSSDYVNFYRRVKRTRLSLALHEPRPIDTKSIGNWKKPEHAARVESIMKDPELCKLIEDLGYDAV